MARAAYGLPGRGPHSGRWIALTSAMAVLVMAAAAMALAVATGRSRGGSPPAGAGVNRTAAQSRRAAGSALTAHGASRATALASRYRVAVTAQAAASPYERTAVSFVTRYFAAINAHDYLAYRRLFNPSIRGELSHAAFSAGYGTTSDSSATLRRVGVIAPNELAAVVTFTSHQKPAQSPSHSACTRWRISLFLVRKSDGYLLQAPPAGYQASLRACG